MCGIYAHFGSNAKQKVLRGLKRLEYRGYDSWGVATIKNHEILLEKQVGKLGGVDKVSLSTYNSSQNLLALGHTRWATHGGVTKINSHPHLAKNGKFALVQNGVVENYQALKKQCIKDNYAFISQTDTEVIVALIEQEMKKKKVNILSRDIFVKVFKMLEGRNTVAVVTVDNRVLAIRNGSPLVVGKSEKEIVFSSDVLSLDDEVNKYTSLNSGEMVELKQGKLTFFNVSSMSKLSKKFVIRKQTTQQHSMDGYSSFMLKEIRQQATMLSGVFNGQDKQFFKTVELIKKADQVITIACGSAGYASSYTAYLLRKQGIKAYGTKTGY